MNKTPKEQGNSGVDSVEYLLGGMECIKCDYPKPSGGMGAEEVCNPDEYEEDRMPELSFEDDETSMVSVNQDSITTIDDDQSVDFELGLAQEIVADQCLLTDSNVWIADTGATVHSANCKDGLINVSDGGDSITAVNGETVKAVKAGNLPGMMCDRNGNTIAKQVMTNVSFMLNGKYNLFSVTKLQQNGWALRGDEEKMELTKGKSKVVFDIVIKMLKGAVYTMYFWQASGGGTKIGNAGVSIMDAHAQLRHCHEDAV